MIKMSHKSYISTLRKNNEFVVPIGIVQSMNDNVTFQCLRNPAHGTFVLKAKEALKLCEPCPVCYIENSRKSHDEFVRDLEAINLSISAVGKYKTSYDLLEFACDYDKSHPNFFKQPNSVLHGSGCPHCSGSDGEKIIAGWLMKNRIPFHTQYKVIIDGSRHYFDFMLKILKIVIEYDGAQHYEWIGNNNELYYFDFINYRNISDDEYDKLQKRDTCKNKWCEDNGYRMIRVGCDDNGLPPKNMTYILDNEVLARRAK